MPKRQSKQTTSNNSPAIQFSFGEPEPINNTDISGLLGVFHDDYNEFYTPPILPNGLDKMARSNAVHRRCINFKVQQMAICFNGGPVNLRDFRRLALDSQVFANFYIENIFNRAGQLVRGQHLPAINMRKCKNFNFKMLRGTKPALEWKQNEVLHGFEYDTAQSIYGVPSWVGAFHDILLNSEATLFRRRYYLNGSHMGYILYTTHPDLDKEVEAQIKSAVSSGKGVGNFKSMFLNIPGGHEKGVQIIPVGDISQKDEFEKIKNISADDIIISHGVNPQLAGMKPENVGGFGDIEKASAWYRANEVQALVQPFLELNEFLPAKLHFKFDFGK